VLTALLLLTASAGPRAHDGHGGGQAARRPDPSAFVRLVRDAIARFRDVVVAEAEGYVLQFGCVSGSETGAMGLHYVNFDLVADPALDPARPEIVIYEPRADGGLRLIGADYLVFADAWHATH